MIRVDWARLLPKVVAPVAALALAAAVSSIALLWVGFEPISVFQVMFEYGAQPDSQAQILTKATYYYLAAVAVAIGFRMNLFNIGVDGQSRLAGVTAAALGAAGFLSWLPGPVRILLMIAVAMAVGGAWAGIAGVLKVTRGVSEVISTIMLNAIAIGIVAYLLTEDLLGERAAGGNLLATPEIPSNSWLPELPFPGTDEGVYLFILVSVAVGVGYWFLLGRTRFGFDLRATGQNPTAAVASGVDARRMVVIAMVLSGAVGGLVMLPEIFGHAHAYSQDLASAGFTGIAIALIGRNHPIGMAFGALLWGFLDRTAIKLDLEEVPREIVTIMQGVAVLAVVVAYELAARVGRRVQQRRVGRALHLTEPEPVPEQVSELAKRVAATGEVEQRSAEESGETSGEERPR